MVAYSNTYSNEDGVLVEITMKAECPTQDDARKALSFMAQSSHRFYLEAAEKINYCTAEGQSSAASKEAAVPSPTPHAGQRSGEGAG